MSTVHFWHVDGSLLACRRSVWHGDGTYPTNDIWRQANQKREREREEEVFERGGKKGKEGQEVVDAREEHVSFKEAGLKQGEKWIIVEWLMLS